MGHSLHYLEVNSTCMPIRHILLLLMKSIPTIGAHGVTFQREEARVFSYPEHEGLLSLIQKLHSGRPALGNPRRTNGPFPYKLQPMKTGESDGFPSTLHGLMGQPVDPRKAWANSRTYSEEWGGGHTHCLSSQSARGGLHKTCNLQLITNYMTKMSSEVQHFWLLSF